MLVLGFAFPSSAFAVTTFCKVEDSSTTVKAIAWDNVTKIAKITDYFNKTHEGRVTLEREHTKHGKKVNIFVKYDEPGNSEDAAEYIIFPMAESAFRIIGVAYIIEDGRQHLSVSKGNYSASCITM